MNYSEITKENGELKEEILRLKNEISNLTEQINILGKHPNLVKGLQGETLIVSLLNGIQTGSTASFDVDLPDRGITIEVKNSRLNKVLVGSTNTKRWNWSRPFGDQGGKKYDQLILIGDADPDYKHLYLDPDSPYVCFDIPFLEIMPLTIKSNSYRSIQLTTNPKKARSTASILFSKYQITLDNLAKRYEL